MIKKDNLVQILSCTFSPPSEMGSDLPGTGVIPGAVGAGQVRMGGTMPGSRGGKRRSGG